MKNIFSQVQATKPSSNTFDLSHDRKMSLNMGDLVPIAAIECVPGDRFQMSTSQLLRFAPMISPVMHRVNVYTHFYFVPNRILWPNWENFITGGEDGTDASTFPSLDLQSSSNGSLADYLGIPSADFDPKIEISAMPFAAYQAIYNEYYRDQNLIDPVDYKLIDSGQDNQAILIQLRKRAWQHDYFTSALPWTQKGAEATIPLGNTAPLQMIDDAQLPTVVRDSQGNPLPFATSLQQVATGGLPSEGFTQTAGQGIQFNVTSHTEVDLSEATASTINDLRRAFKLQEWLEKNARGGSRYIESILSHFGVRSSDARLQRPEFLGGGSSPVTISEVLQTSAAETEPTPQANMAGHGISVGASNNFSYSCEEHGYIIGIMSVMPKTAYQQGVPKHFKKFDKFDYFWPSFGHLGEQPIMQQELYVDITGSDTNDDVFGYTPRYAEYKYLSSSVHGEFRSSLDFWHMGRIFENNPQLNQQFIEADPTDRIFAVLNAEKLYAHVFHKIKASRRMPYFGTPTL